MDFEWDEVKNAINRVKHSIDFADACKVFFDPMALTREDTRAAYGEARYQIIGMASFGVLFVVYTERAEDTIRIISARKAEKHERRAYESGGV